MISINMILILSNYVFIKYIHTEKGNEKIHSSPHIHGGHSKTPSGCLKPQIEPNPM